MSADRPTVIIPVKPFAEAKSRLAPLLSPDQRATLSRQLFAHVLRTVLAVEQRADCVVVSRSAEVLAMARDMGASGLTERGRDLNGAVRQALSCAPADRSVLVISSDLPLLARPDVEALLGKAGTQVVVATDGKGEGTNGLFLTRPGLIDPRFGPHSHKAHRSAAEAAGLTCASVLLPGLAADLDLAEDLVRLRSAGWSGKLES